MTDGQTGLILYDPVLTEVGGPKENKVPCLKQAITIILKMFLWISDHRVHR